MQPEPGESPTPMRSAGQFVCRILIVDSDRSRSDSGTSLAERLGHRVRTAYRGVMAVEIAKRFVPDVVLIDFSQPDAGLAVAAAIRRMPLGQCAYIVALTDEMDANKPAVYGDTVDARLVMPLTADTLEQILSHRYEVVHGLRARARTSEGRSA